MSNPNLWAGDSTPLSLLLPQTVTSVVVTGTGVDVTPFFGSVMAVLHSAPGTSDTLTTNGAFASDTGWTKGTGWTISGGKAVASLTAAADLKQNQACTAASRYTVKFTISNYVAGSVTPKLGGTAGTARSANGTYTEVIVCGAGADPKLVFAGSPGADLQIDDVSVIAAQLDVKLQESSDDSTYTDVAGGAFAPVNGLASLQVLPVNIDRAKQYMRAVGVPNAAATPSWVAGVQLIGKQQR